MKENTFLILGGDNRSVYLGEYLEKQGLRVCYYAFNHADCFNSLKEAINEAECIILPLPVTRDRITLNTPLFDEKIALSDIYAAASADKLFFGGQIPKGFCEELDSRKCSYYDYFLMPEIAVYNAVPTAEGVLEILFRELPVTVHDMKCAVLGYGKVGKVLSLTLKNVGADVTVFARKAEDFADIRTKSMTAGEYKELSASPQHYDAIINTVPTEVLGREELKNINSDCLLVEIASAPFGIDFQAAKELAIQVIKAGSLPGKTAPKTAGFIIGHSILPIIQARGLIN